MNLHRFWDFGGDEENKEKSFNGNTELDDYDMAAVGGKRIL